LFHKLVIRHGQLPKGVLVPFRWKRGRPNETEAIYEAWIAKVLLSVCGVDAPDYAAGKSEATPAAASC